ncbi:pentatricopeptide repeat-containing protein At3g49240, mitochondrial [Beta vulgaris subsp. vulgaris]|uniref:pentatricopeptide repeat-containing protein At3g49240, mitochondrial n=1 Tax=Beta vulgaris subsp. vulgaris TaxID=3555 RepID=UPI002036A95C|nr:pentatricopeptide repeat-containing protein At3g49240, mitochondrial [Beta vulgaris subsp. vulgaris]
MALSKPSSFLHRVKSLPLSFPYHHRTLRPHSPPLISFRRLLSFATADDIATERRKRRRQVRMQPPLSPQRHQQQQQQQHRAPITNPNAPKVPEHVFALTGTRLACHNKILKLIRENDLDEAALYTRHSVYSNCRPTIFTCNAVMAALLRQSRYSDFLSLHRFITQAGIGSNIITYNLLITLYCECRKPDTALEHYKRLIEDAPFDPSPTTYRILVKGLVDNNKVEKAIEIKDEMLSRAFDADAVVYGYLMNGCAKNKDGDKVLEIYEELMEKLGGKVTKGIIYGPLMKGYFLKGMQKEAISVFDEVMGENSTIKMDDIAYNLVLDAFVKHGKFEEALKLFEKMKSLHNPPWKLTVNLGSYNVMADGYCAEGKFKEAVDVFMSMGEKNCSPDILSFNNLIEQLCNNGLLPEGEELCGKMSDKGINPDEVTYCLLMDACFKENRPDDAAGYFSKMIEANLRPNLAVYNKLVEGLVQVGKIDEAKSFFDLMVKKLKFNPASYEFMFKALCDVGKVDDVLKIVGDMLDEESVDLNEDMHKIVKDGLKSHGREEEELDRLIEQKEKEKEEAKRREIEEAERAKASARAAVASLIPSKLFGNKEDDKESTALPGSAGTISNNEAQAGEEASAASALGGLTAETVIEGNSAAESAFKSVDSAQATA